MLKDMTGAAFNAVALAREGHCFLWQSGQFMCAAKQRERDSVVYLPRQLRDTINRPWSDSD